MSHLLRRKEGGISQSCFNKEDVVDGRSYFHLLSNIPVKVVRVGWNSQSETSPLKAVDPENIYLTSSTFFMSHELKSWLKAEAPVAQKRMLVG